MSPSRSGRLPRLLLCAAAACAPLHAAAEEPPSPPWALIGLGDSLTHGTMDGTNNAINTANAYLQRTFAALGQRVTVGLNQPYFDLQEERINPALFPTNLAVDGADSFTLEGLSYYKRAGTLTSLPSSSLLADQLYPWQLEDKYDKVLYPINLLTGGSTSQIGAAEWLLNVGLPWGGIDRAITLYWVGNNDSSRSALGFGGSNPAYVPLPADEIFFALPEISLLLQLGAALGEVSLEPYSLASIDRNLTDLADFEAQNWSLLRRLTAAGPSVDNHIFVVTLPYYSAVGYLFDSEDLEYYLGKLDPAYRVPPTFARVAPRGQPITDGFAGDRVSLLTFGVMYTLLETGYPVSWVNRVLERGGQQRDGLVLSQSEAQYIRTRIDGYNAALRELADDAGPNVHIVDLGPLLSAVLGGQLPVTIGGKKVSRKWIRGGAFTFDGAHPGYTGQALIANVVTAHVNAVLGFDAPYTSLSSVLATDPYADNDGDGWAAGPPYAAGGLTEVLFLFRDPDDTNAAAQVDLPPDVWDRIEAALLADLLPLAPALRPEAERLGLVAASE